MTRRLVLRRETLAELTSTDLRLVAGGAVPSGPTCGTATSCALYCAATDVVRETTSPVITPSCP